MTLLVGLALRGNYWYYRRRACSCGHTSGLCRWETPLLFNISSLKLQRCYTAGAALFLETQTGAWRYCGWSTSLEQSLAEWAGLRDETPLFCLKMIPSRLITKNACTYGVADDLNVRVEGVLLWSLGPTVAFVFVALVSHMLAFLQLSGSLLAKHLKMNNVGAHNAPFAANQLELTELPR